MSSAQDLTKDTFESTVAQGVTVVDFWAEWCAPCRMMGPILDELAADYDGKITVAKVDVDSEMELAGKFQVSSIPTLLIIKDGEIVQRFIGVTGKAMLADAIDKATA
ncbi:MAG: thioredoxin [Candidatus Hydrogenedentes bacterium]|nr:thioredoxin [Candidatus Hydrogenedentota bacterium]